MASSTPAQASSSSEKEEFSQQKLAENFSHESRQNFTYNRRFELVAANHKFSHRLAFPPPDGVASEVWRKAYNRADTELYTKNGKNAKKSEALRKDGTTRHRAEELIRADESNKKDSANMGKGQGGKGKGKRPAEVSGGDDSEAPAKDEDAQKVIPQGEGSAKPDEESAEDVLMSEPSVPEPPSTSKGKEKEKMVAPKTKVPAGLGAADSTSAGSSSTPKSKENFTIVAPKNESPAGVSAADSAAAGPSSSRKSTEEPESGGPKNEVPAGLSAADSVTAGPSSSRKSTEEPESGGPKNEVPAGLSAADSPLAESSSAPKSQDKPKQAVSEDKDTAQADADFDMLFEAVSEEEAIALAQADFAVLFGDVNAQPDVNFAVLFGDDPKDEDTAQADADFAKLFRAFTENDDTAQADADYALHCGIPLPDFESYHSPEDDPITPEDFDVDYPSDPDTKGNSQTWEEDSDADVATYCVCRKGDDNTLMIQCEKCNEWFHFRCIDPVTPRPNGEMSSVYRVDGVNYRFKDIHALIHQFFCRECYEPGKYDIMFKARCRRRGCLKPAIGPRPGESGPFLYCSDECQIAYFSLFVSEMPDDGLPSLGGILRKHELAGLLQERCTAKEFKELGHIRPSMYKDEDTFEIARNAVIEELKQIILAPGGGYRVHDPKPLTSSREDMRRQFYEMLERNSASAWPKIKVPDGFGYGDENFPWRVLFNTELYDMMLDFARKLNRIYEEQKQWKKHIQFIRMVEARHLVIQQEYIGKHGGKKICGYDPRLCMNFYEFKSWFKSAEAIAAFETGKLGDPKDDSDPQYYKSCCIRKTCGHIGWVKNEMDTAKMEQDSLGRDERRITHKRDDLFKDRDTKYAMRGDPARQGKVTVVGKPFTFKP